MNKDRINVCTDTETKKQAEILLEQMGLNMTTAINMYLRRIIMEGGIPFEITANVPNSLTANAIEEGRKIAKDKNVESFESADELRRSIGV